MRGSRCATGGPLEEDSLTTPSAAPEGPPQTASARIVPIESLRAIAAISILAFHAVFASGLAESGSAIKPFASRLEVGVSIFFLISGFLLYRPFARSHLEGSRAPLLSRYASSRVLRIIPAYWFALFVIAIWIGLEGVFGWPGLFVYFGFFQNYDPDTLGGGLLQAWSLVVEMSFYIFLPVFAIALTRFQAPTVAARWRNQWIGLAILFATGIAWNAGVLAAVGIQDRMAGPLLASLPAYLDQFALGMALALVMVAPEDLGRRFTGLLERVSPIAWVGVAALAFLIASKGIGLEGGQEPISSLQWFVKHLLFTLIAVSLLIPAVMPLGESDPVGRFLSHRSLRWLGLVSYGIFLWHLAVLSELERLGFETSFGAAVNWVFWVGIALIPTMIIAAFSWYAIERPALARRGWLTGILSARGWGRRGAGERT